MKKQQPTHSPPVRSSPGPSSRKGCAIRVCRDPVTGKMIAQPTGPCPEGYVEEMIREIGEKGLWFPPPELLRTQEDDDEGKP